MEQEQPRNDLVERLEKWAAMPSVVGLSGDFREAAEALRAADELAQALVDAEGQHHATAYEMVKPRLTAYRSARGQ